MPIPASLMTGRYLLPMLLLLPTMTFARGIYQEPDDFLTEVFGGNVPASQLFWITKELQTDIQNILGHRLNLLRLRYWARDKQTVWILEEIGKEQAITTGIVVNDGQIEMIKVLVYRESRGWEIRHPFFTEQFKGAELTADNSLSQAIDGISGATLSVRALTRLARLALFLHQQTDFNDATPQ